MDGDYRQPFEIPIPNFFAFVPRANARPTSAMSSAAWPTGKSVARIDLDSRSEPIAGSRPTGKPMTLVGAMINVAITGLYVDAIADGMRLQAWREPQLAALQDQLQEINLPPFVMEAFRVKGMAICHALETMKPSKLISTFKETPINRPSRKVSFWH